MSRGPLSLVLAGIVLVLGGALIFQYWGGLAPCELCLYERWPYYAALPLALALTTRETARADARLGAALLLAIFCGSSVLAFYHVGVEQHWFAGPTACTGTGGSATTIDELRKLLMTQQTVRCDAPQWTLFGVSLAGYNLLASLALAILAGAAARGPAR
ncbi:MAG TPA: disulfide bond formation protein B [Stellaceae bacterium]|nr:disulfide bond formation protein B [Stellaceae bacterium]